MKLGWPTCIVAWISLASTVALVITLSFALIFPMYGKYSSREHLGTMILSVLMSPLRNEIESFLLSGSEIDIPNPKALLRTDLMPSWSVDPVADRITISPAGGITMFSEKFQIELMLTPEISGEGEILWFCSGTPVSLFGEQRGVQAHLFKGDSIELWGLMSQSRAIGSGKAMAVPIDYTVGLLAPILGLSLRMVPSLEERLVIRPWLSYP